MNGLFKCNMENDEMGRASSSHFNLTQHARVRQQLAGKAASHFPEPTYVTSRSREHFPRWQSMERADGGSCARIYASSVLSLKKLRCALFSRCIINKISYERFNERRNDCGVANLSRVPLECPWRRRDEQLINTSTSSVDGSRSRLSARSTSREYRQPFLPPWKSFLLPRKGPTRRRALLRPFPSLDVLFVHSLLSGSIYRVSPSLPVFSTLLVAFARSAGN